MAVAYVVAIAVIFGINLMPAFGPPTWSVMVLFRLRSHLDPVALVVVGALAAASGRYLLARASRHFRGRLSPQRRANLDAARRHLTANSTRSVVGLGIFALSPVPSAQLFEAAGLMDVSLGPVVVAFFAGRLVSYSLYVSGASALSHTDFGRVFASTLTSPWGIAIQVVLLVAIVALGRVDWAARLARRGE